jgi:hypothetical protein
VLRRFLASSKGNAMLNVITEAILEAVLSALSWVARIVGTLAYAAMEASLWTVNDVPVDRAERRLRRRRLRRMGDACDVEGLERAYRRKGIGEEHRDRRIEALRQLARADPQAAEPLLREVICEAEDARLVIAAMDCAVQYRIGELRDAVERAKGDRRPAVAAHAAYVARRLARRARLAGSTVAPIAWRRPVRQRRAHDR